MLVRQDIPCCVRRCTVVRCLYYVLGTARLSPWSAVLHPVHGAPKIRLMKVLVWPVATYGCESWTLRKNEETCLDAFEVKGLRDSAGFMYSKENK